MEQLLLKIQEEENQGAFRELYHLYYFKLYQFAFSFLKKKEPSEEVVNDVFLRLWKKRDTLTTIKNFDVYIYTAVKNAALNYLRDNRQLYTNALEQIETSHLKLQITPESRLLSEELKSEVQRAIASLPPRCQLIFKMVKEDGLSYREVALILDISAKTVDAQLYIALKKLSVSLFPVWTEYIALSK